MYFAVGRAVPAGGVAEVVEDFGEFVDGGFDEALADFAGALAGVAFGAGGGVGVEGVGPLELKVGEGLEHGHEGLVEGAEGQRFLHG